MASRYDPSSGGGDHPTITNINHGPCANCGQAGYAHDRVRVYPDDGPPGTYHFEMRCPA